MGGGSFLVLHGFFYPLNLFHVTQIMVYNKTKSITQFELNPSGKQPKCRRFVRHVPYTRFKRYKNNNENLLYNNIYFIIASKYSAERIKQI